jgi:DNA-binding MarR family transcriptional regulator
VTAPARQLPDRYRSAAGLSTHDATRLDPVAEARWLDDTEQQAWREFLWATRLLFEALDRQLQRDSGMPHTYYMILATLSEAPARTMTMGQLAEVLRSSPSRLSHAVSRMEADGWVRRSRNPDNRRITNAHLTDLGFDTLAAAAPGHVEAVRRHLFDRLSPEQVAALHEMCGTVRAGLEPGAAPPGRDAV